MMNINNLYFARIDVVLDIDYPDFDKVKYVSKRKVMKLVRKKAK